MQRPGGLINIVCWVWAKWSSNKLDVYIIVKLDVYIVRSPAASAVTAVSLGQHFISDLQYSLSISFYDHIFGNELWPEFCARGEFSALRLFLVKFLESFTDLLACIICYPGNIFTCFVFHIFLCPSYTLALVSFILFQIFFRFRLLHCSSTSTLGVGKSLLLVKNISSAISRFLGCICAMVMHS